MVTLEASRKALVKFTHLIEAYKSVRECDDHNCIGSCYDVVGAGVENCKHVGPSEWVLRAR